MYDRFAPAGGEVTGGFAHPLMVNRSVVTCYSKGNVGHSIVGYYLP